MFVPAAGEVLALEQKLGIKTRDSCSLWDGMKLTIERSNLLLRWSPCARALSLPRGWRASIEGLPKRYPCQPSSNFTSYGSRTRLAWYRAVKATRRCCKQGSSRQISRYTDCKLSLFGSRRYLCILLGCLRRSVISDILD